MMRAIVAGPDADELGAALADEGVDVTFLEDVATRPTLEDAAVLETDLLVITDVGQSTAVPIAKDLNDGISVIIYDRESAPEFVRGQADLILDPELLGPDAVAEELTAED